MGKERWESMRHKKGFISIYFLALFLFYGYYLGEQLDFKKKEMMIQENLKKDFAFYLEERKIIRQVECDLKKGSVKENKIIKEIYYPQKKKMEIKVDLVNKEVIEYHFQVDKSF